MNTQPRRRRAVDVRALITGIVSAVVFVSAITLVIVNQRVIGWANLGLMFVGLAALLVLLWLYNRRHR